MRKAAEKLAAFKSASAAEPRRVVVLSGRLDAGTSTERAQSGTLALDAEDVPTT